MSRLDGKQPNAGAIFVGAIIFSLVAAGLFFAFRPVPDPTDAGFNNSAPATESSAPKTMDETAAGEASENSLTTILTPLPEATAAPTMIPTGVPTAAPMPEETPTNGEFALPSVTPAVAPMENVTENSVSSARAR